MTLEINQMEVELNTKLEKIKSRRGFLLRDAFVDIEHEINEKLKQCAVEKRNRIRELMRNVSESLMEYELTTDIEEKFVAACKAHHTVDDLYWLIDVSRAKLLVIRKEILKEKIVILPFARKIRSERNTVC